MAPIPRTRAFSGPPILSHGFRPFFLAGSLYAGLSILAWIPAFSGELALTTAFAPRDWHIHEMLYGMLPAIITGFLLTAVPNWTGRLPIQGAGLLSLLALWLLGRLAVTTSAFTGGWLSAGADMLFLAALSAVVAREIVAGKNYRNLKVLIPVALLATGNGLFHWEALTQGTAEYSIRVGLSAVMLLIMLIGGRIVPSFTRNWLARERPGRLPVPFGRFDAVAMLAAAVALVAWIVAPLTPIAGVLMLAAALLHLWRLARWAGDRALGEPLVFVLHAAYAFVPLGFLLNGLVPLIGCPTAAGIHAWSGGAVGLMTLAVMSRASLGHTGRALKADRITQLLYVSVTLATVLRIAAAVLPEFSMGLMHGAGVLWAAAFLGFGISYWRVMTGPVEAPRAPVRA